MTGYDMMYIKLKIYNMILCDMLYDMICDMIWYDMIYYLWCDVMWHDTWYMVYDMIWYMTRPDWTRHDTIRYILYDIWYDTIWYDTIRYISFRFLLYKQYCRPSFIWIINDHTSEGRGGILTFIFPFRLDIYINNVFFICNMLHNSHFRSVL